MSLSEQNRNTLLINLHKVIEEAAHHSANDILHGRVDQLTYPPNGGLTDPEMEAVKRLQGDETLRNALRKLFANNNASVFFDFFNLLDGTGDPDPGTGKWSEVKLVDFTDDVDEDGEMLHDCFFETYWEWRKKRKADWKLDLYDGD
jgi:hypothetical protein